MKANQFISCPVCGQTPCNCTHIAEGLRDPKDNPCWKGYHPVGTKKKNGRTVPNCVPNANEGVAEAGNKPLEKSRIGTGDTRTPRELKTQMQGASDEFVKSTADKKTGPFHSRVAKMQGKLAKSELRRREQGVAEGSETAADIDKKIEFHKQGQAAAQYKGSMNKMHAAKIRELLAKKEALKKQGVAEGSNELYQQAIRKYTQRVANDYLGGGNAHLYGAGNFDSDMFGVDPKQAEQDFDRLFPKYLKKLQGGGQGVAEGQLDEISADPAYLRAAERSRSQAQATQRTPGRSPEEKAAARRTELKRDRGIAGYTKRHRVAHPEMYPTPKAQPAPQLRDPSTEYSDDYSVWAAGRRDTREQGVAEGSEQYYAIVHKVNNKPLSTHRNLESAKDEWRGLDQNQRQFYKVVTTKKAPKDWSMKEQGVAEGFDDISVGDYVSYDDGPGTDRWEVVSIEGNRVELRNEQGGTTFADINDVFKEQGVAEDRPVDSDGYTVDREDAGEYDYEGDQAKDQLQTIVAAARKLDGMLDDNENMPEWVQMKITKATDYLDTAADYVAANKAQAEPMAEAEPEKIGGRHEPADFDNMVSRLKKLAGAGPMKTVYDPNTRRYRNVPTAQQPGDKK